MKIKCIIFTLILSGFIFLQDPVDNLRVESDSKAPLIISTLPFLNNEPAVMFALSTLLLAIHSKDTLSNNYPDPNTAMFLSSIPLLNLVSDSEIGYIILEAKLASLITLEISIKELFFGKFIKVFSYTFLKKKL